MSDLNVFNLFSLLTLELRLLIWTLAFVPRVIPLEAEGYEEGADPTALPFYVIQGRRHPNPDHHATRSMWTGRFVPSYIPIQAVFQVSQESRNHAFFLGYRVWKMQKRGGLVRNVIWNPAKDFVLFPHRSLDEQLDIGEPFIHPHNWLRMFHAQFPMEISIMQNVAMHTSLWFRYKLEYNWVVDQLFKFKGMRRLTMVIDRRYERDIVKGLHARNLDEESWGSWKLPYAIIETLETIKDQTANLRINIPEVRLVEDVGGILTSPGLETTLRCNPCEYLGLEQMALETL
jgi:hypothetical protein